MQWFIDNRPDFLESLQKFHYFRRWPWRPRWRPIPRRRTTAPPPGRPRFRQSRRTLRGRDWAL